MRRTLTTSQLFSRLLTSCQLFSTTVISVQLFLTLLNSLFMFLPSSQLFSAYLDSSHLSSTRPFFFSTRLKWHKCKLVQLLFHSLDSFDSFKLRSSCRKEILPSVQLSIRLWRLLQSSYHSLLHHHFSNFRNRSCICELSRPIIQRREKVTWNPQLHCAHESSRIRQQSDDARTRRSREPTFLRNGTSVSPEKQNVSCKS